MKLKYSDKAHGYWLDGKRTKSVTAVVSLPDDKSQLTAWKLRKVVTGLALSPDLYESIVKTDEDVRNHHIDAAMLAAGASDKADYGTATHEVTERGDRGEELDLLEQVTYARWQELCAAAGLAVDRNYIEGCIVYPEERVCGRYDRFMRRPDGTLRVVDLKTGASAINYPHSTVCQLATYAHAPLMCDIGPKGDGETEEFFPLPEELDRNVGVVIYMPADGPGGVYEVNLRLGWACMEQIVFPGLRWRSMAHSSLIKKVAG